MPEILTWRAILDILLIAAGLFFLYRTLIRLGTWKIVTGILIAIVFFLIANYMDLKGIEWIYRNVSHVAVIGLIVLFQPELRKMFERAASLHRSKSLPRDEALARVIGESLWKLAQKRIGAIIVIPGKEPVGQWLTGGYALNADPSMPLILSIFDPNSPGHDGALIVQKSRFAFFGVRLPGSRSGKLSEEYGTRHQAAMGLCEKSDALVLVVSEERGKVSVFHKGRMTPIESEKQIAEKICLYCGKTGPLQMERQARRIRKSLAFEILGSTAAAFTFWTMLIASQVEILEKVVTASVEYTATAEDFVMIGEKAKEVRLHLSGAKSDLDAVTPSDLNVKINLSRAVEGKQTFVITDDSIRLPEGVRVLGAEPPSIDITIARLVKKEIDVDPQLIGRLPAGLRLVSMTVKPEKIRVILPTGESNEKLENITTTPIYLDNIHEDSVLFCKIISPPSIQPVEKRWPDVEIALKIRKNSLTENGQ